MEQRHGVLYTGTQNRQNLDAEDHDASESPFCDHTEGVESGVRAWERDFGERERASGTSLADAVEYTVMMNMAPIFPRTTQLDVVQSNQSSDSLNYLVSFTDTKPLLKLFGAVQTHSKKDGS